MSSIDQYKHAHLGFIECPSTFEIAYDNQSKRIALYQLLEDIPAEEKDFDGKTGDIVLGGGSGEAPAFRIALPEALYFFTKDDWDDFENYENLFKAFWTPTQSYNFCEGFLKKGWKPNSPIEFWLAENIIYLLIENNNQYPNLHTNPLPKSALTFFKTFK